MQKIRYKFRGESIIESVKTVENSRIFGFPCSNSDDCDPYEVTLGDGFYIFECWGGNGNGVVNRGNGSYTKGTIHITNDTTFFIHIGASNGKYNSVPPWASTSYGYNGGGATDIRISSLPYYEFESLKSRIMVSAGGGSIEYASGYGMNGGALIGEPGITTLNGDGNARNILANGGSQESGGDGNSSYVIVGSFGLAGFLNETSDWGATGGGGYYGGGGGADISGGGGGSGYIADGVLHGYVLNGSQFFLDPDNNLEKGHSGDGFAIIECIQNFESSIHHEKNLFNPVFFYILLTSYFYKIAIDHNTCQE